ncbi:GatB/YqeY domain-containing protein [Thioalkalivibrio sp. HK1]|uniref:GatB/YqeY domain-containing protein n=1 Tax=Thioalkalivibrio sp. HK1 TaxID=1469245 RepID=UPI000471F6E6|nr:GatB/YqeY domain-containing protein [Thioalkalivibrio sp. HK1]
MSQTLKERIDNDVKDAMRARDRERLSVLRLVGAAIKQREVDERIDLDDVATIEVLDRMLKQRRDSIRQYEDAGREDLAATERKEVEIIGGYLPAPLDEAEIDALIAEAIERSGATDLKRMGEVMALLKPQVSGRAEMSKVSMKVKDRLRA